jgi:alpha/beta superfamily hydrolase
VGSLDLQSPAGALVARVDAPRTGPPATGPTAAVVCHPHPLFGGTLDNKVVVGVARALTDLGLLVVRFNFRGAGGSEGRHDAGRGELEDVRAALDAAADLAPDERPRPLLMAGYSFGAWVGLRAGIGDARVAALLAVAPPVNLYDFSEVADSDRPLAVVYARQDEIVSTRAVEAWLTTCANPARVTAVDGAGHLFHGRQAAVRDAVREFVQALG